MAAGGVHYRDAMAIPEGYVEALIDEVGPFGFEYAAAVTSDDPDDEGDVEIRFEADPLSFAARYPGLGLTFREGYGEDEWPPHRLDLRVLIDRHGDPEAIEFEVVDVLSWTASEAPELHDRLNTLSDPDDHAAALGEALGLLLERQDPISDDYFA